MLRLRQLSQGLVPGSVLTSGVRGRYLVANVAVHPDFRRQGIARDLMETVVQSVEEQGGRELLLQVRQDNVAAIRLYESIGFRLIGSMTSWYSSFNSFRLLPAALGTQGPDYSGGFFIRPLRRDEWRAAYQLDVSAVHPDLNWPEPLPRDQYRAGLWRWISDLINGRQVETWVAEAEGGQLAGLAMLLSEWGRYHTLTLRALPQWHGAVEQPLLAKLLRRLQYTHRRNIRIDHPAGDVVTGDLLRRAHFEPRRTLSTMRLRVEEALY
jgi:hypothetical protein